MSEIETKYIACAAGNNAQAECKIALRGDLIRIVGHPRMEFAPDDARALAEWIERALGKRDNIFDKIELAGKAAMETVRYLELLRRDLEKMIDDGR